MAYPLNYLIVFIPLFVSSVWPPVSRENNIDESLFQEVRGHCGDLASGMKEGGIKISRKMNQSENPSHYLALLTFATDRALLALTRSSIPRSSSLGS